MRSAALPCALLALALQPGGAQAGDPLPPLAPVDVEAVLPPPLYKPSGPRVSSRATAAAHARALKADPLHGDAWIVERTAGERDAQRVVFVIPQFHRHPSIPVTWNTFGKAIIHVQRNVEALVTRLNDRHGLSCVGTEGSWVNDIDTPFELRQVATWSQDLRRAREELEKQRDANAVKGALREVHDLLQTELERVASVYDGVGMAQVRARRPLARFGLEDRELNQRGLALHAEMKALDDKLALLDPGTRSIATSAMGELWLLEIDEHEERVLGPLRRGLAKLDAHRTQLRHKAGDAAAFPASRFVSLARLITERVVQLDEIDAHTAYYREVADKVAQGITEEGEARAFTPEEARERERLLAARAKLQAKYDEVTLKARDRAAVKRLVARMPAAGTCALVFGMAHTDGLVRALEAEPDLGVVVVTPYDPEALKRGDVN